MSQETDTPEQPIFDWTCDCKDGNIRWVDENRYHPAMAREGWFCMRCLNEFIERQDLETLRNAVRNVRDAKGRHHTQLATERLFALLPENDIIQP